jgi:hypothetical protein
MLETFVTEAIIELIIFVCRFVCLFIYLLSSELNYLQIFAVVVDLPSPCVQGLGLIEIIVNKKIVHQYEGRNVSAWYMPVLCSQLRYFTQFVNDFWYVIRFSFVLKTLCLT